jgi:predicted RNA-binding protein with RPS1 domain
LKKKIDDKIKIKIIKIKFDIKNNLAVHFVSIRGKHKKKKKEKKKKKDEWSSEPNQSSSTHKCCMWR